MSEVHTLFHGFWSLMKLSVEQDADCAVYNLLVELEKTADRSQSAAIRFSDISRLAVKDVGGGLTQLGNVAVTDISRDQIDRTNYLVQDLENGHVEFYCRSYDRL